MANNKSKSSNSLKINIIGIIIATISLLTAFVSGPLGYFLKSIYHFVLGSNVLIYACLTFIIGILLALFGRIPVLKTSQKIGIILIIFCYLVFIARPINEYSNLKGFDVLSIFIDNLFNNAKDYVGIVSKGGIIGTFFYSIISALVDKTGTYIILGALLFVALLLLNIFSLLKPFKKIFDSSNKKSKKNNNKTEVLEDYSREEQIPEKPKKKVIDFDKKENNEDDYKLTTNNKIDYIALNPDKLLDKPVLTKNNYANSKAASAKGRRLIEVLDDFGVNCTLVNTTIGPSVTKFEIKPDSNVKISKINNYADNLKMELAAKSLRIEAPVPGKSVVGVEIPNVEMTPVKMYDIVNNIPDNYREKLLVFGLGKDLSGKNVYCQLDKMPHLLVAGATGSGKSVCINSIINTILLRCSPNDVRLLLIDPKKVEFTAYKDIPHLIGPVVNDPKQASIALGLIVQEMDRRYDTFASCNQKQIDGYNDYVVANGGNKLPRIVVIIDELADLMMTCKNDVEHSIQRITQLARAAGIHLIVATQRPSTDVITGIIKANIPSRIAFAVSSGIDSRTIIDSYGAEKLLGNGDMLYWPTGESSPIRVQGVYITDGEIDRISKAATAKGRVPYFDAFAMINDLDSETEGGYDNSSFNDNIYDDVVKFVAETKKASTSLVQRKFGIGYNRAARIIDVMEQRGLIGPAQGSKPREVFVTLEELDSK